MYIVLSSNQTKLKVMSRILMLFLLTASGMIAQTDRNPDAEATRILQGVGKKDGKL